MSTYIQHTGEAIQRKCETEANATTTKEAMPKHKQKGSLVTLYSCLKFQIFVCDKEWRFARVYLLKGGYTAQVYRIYA